MVRVEEWNARFATPRFLVGLRSSAKTLSHHEIATVQTTAIDPAAGIVSLTTVLAHSSGEWIASDWPVCGVEETATPHRMGAALSYARRYALFTLVGIAGEDDIDVPDLPTRTSPSGPDGCGPRKNGGFRAGQDQLSRGQPDGTISHDRAAKATVSPSPTMLDPAASAALRDRLSDELKSIGSAEEAAMWAHRVLGAKSTLIAADAKQIEEAFRERVAAYEAANEVGGRRKARSRKSTRENNTPSIPKAYWAIPSHGEFVTASMRGFLPNNPVSFARALLRIRIICVSPSTGRLVARSVMSSPCRSAGASSGNPSLW